MKKLRFFSLLAVVLFSAFKITDTPSPILGRWELKGIDQGQPFSFLVVFRTNGNYDGFVNKKTFVSGTFHMKHDTLYIADSICNSAYEGMYKVQYHGQQDSLTFHVIRDTCRARREGSDGFTFKKVRAGAK
jgi:hypothetical protein